MNEIKNDKEKCLKECAKINRNIKKIHTVLGSIEEEKEKLIIQLKELRKAQNKLIVSLSEKYNLKKADLCHLEE